MRKILPLFVAACFSVLAQAQGSPADSVSNTTAVTATITAANPSDSSSNSMTTDLLPKHMLPTQRLLWGEHGLMRNLDAFTLTEEHRDKELEIRDFMFTAHRYLGYATLAGMIAQGIVGQKLYDGNWRLKDLHEGLAGAVNIGYFGTASLAFLSPPRMRDRAVGFNPLTIHKCLSVVHLTSMIATNVLSGMIESNPGLRPWHRAAAYTAFGSFFASMVVIHF